MSVRQDRSRVHTGRFNGRVDIQNTCGNATVDGHASRWFFEVCDQLNADCKDALERLSAELVNIQGVSVASD